MANLKTYYTCQACGYQSLRWMGRCPDCGEWNTLVEEKQAEKSVLKKAWITEADDRPQAINNIKKEAGDRFQTGLAEFDRVLGGGIVLGSIILLGGDPGIGKSTLLLQILDGISAKEKIVLYVSGEESAKQIKIRGDRLDIQGNNLFVLSETCLEKIFEHVDQLHPKILVIDSIQTVFTPELQSAPGSISQIREVAGRLMYMSKKKGVTTFLIGHVTKDGALAGPRVLEHIVDTVLYFEGNRGHSYRILRTVKNRFGSTNELGVFEMKDKGLVEISNPSELFLAERPLNGSGSVVVSTIEGTRPILVELQALVSSTNFGMPRRMATGVDYNRVSLLITVLEKRIGLHLQNQDVYVNVVGGVKVEEPAIDLGIITAIASSFRNKPADSKTVVFGEVGLVGEVRAINYAELRVKEASKLGFKRCIIPKSNLRKLDIDVPIKVIGVTSVENALDILFT